MRCIIIEDQTPAQRILEKYIADLENLELVGTFADALDAIPFLKENKVELIFLDIHLPKLSGMDLLKVLDPRPHVILTTAFSDYALDSYEYSVVDYLLKPFSFERFVRAVSRIPAKTNIGKDTEKEGSREDIFIKSGHELLKITLSEIFYIHSDSDYTELVTEKKKYLSQKPLRYWEDRLRNNGFLRTHKSYIVNLSRVEKIIGNQVYLTAGYNAPIGRAYKEAFLKGITES